MPPLIFPFAKDLFCISCIEVLYTILTPKRHGIEPYKRINQRSRTVIFPCRFINYSFLKTQFREYSRCGSHYISAARFRIDAEAVTSLQEGFKSMRKPLHRCSELSNRSGGNYIAAASFQITLEAITSLQRAFKSLWRPLHRCSKLSTTILPFYHPTILPFYHPTFLPLFISHPSLNLITFAPFKSKFIKFAQRRLKNPHLS